METEMNLDKNPAGSLVTEHRLLEVRVQAGLVFFAAGVFRDQ